MTADLAVLVPSRGRPDNLIRLMEAVHKTSRGITHVIAGVDEDDPKLQSYREIPFHDGDQLHVHSRMNLVDWTNYLAKKHHQDYNYMASLGDDMVPRTIGWDLKLTGAIEEDFNGTGFSYPWDQVRDDIPEAYVFSTDIYEALGWIMMPRLNHWYNDNVIADLGHGAGCIRQLRGVIVDHLNVATGKAQVDQTAIDQGAKIEEDKHIYEQWFRSQQRFKDIQVIKDLFQ